MSDTDRIEDLGQRLRELGIQPSAQRIAIAGYVLRTDQHPSADQVWRDVRQTFPMVSRATVYNTLNLFVKKGLLRVFELGEGAGVFDANVEPHHHFIDDESGEVHDVSWDRIHVGNIEGLEEFDINEYMVVLRGRCRS